MNSEDTSSGVEELIQRLHREGLSKGQEEAEGLLAAAREKAAKIIDQAKAEADEIVAAAVNEAEQTRIAGKEAVRLAGRDTILQLNEDLRADFDQKVRGLVGHTLKDTEFLKQLILEIARKSLPEESQSPMHITVLLTELESGTTPDTSNDDPINQFIRSLSGEALRDGLTCETEEGEVPGIRVQVKDEHLEIDLNADTITRMLIKHLSPRFRAIVDQGEGAW